MAADLERSKVTCRVRLILWLPLFLINGWEIETQERGEKSILSSSFLWLFIDAGIRYSCCEIHLLALSPLLWCTLNSLLSFLFSPLGLALLFHWCAVVHSLSALLLAGILMRHLCFRYSAASGLRLSHTTKTTLGWIHWTVLNAVH